VFSVPLAVLVAFALLMSSAFAMVLAVLITWPLSYPLSQGCIVAFV
jgi:hypothetical protein